MTIGLSKEATRKVAECLDQHLADLFVLYAKLHNYHWNVVGRKFFVLHAQLEEFYDSAAEEIDEVAERILMIGHRPSASLAAYLKKATLREEDSSPAKSDDLVRQLVADYTTLIMGLRKGIEAAQEIGDEASADLMVGYIAGYEKTVWMLNAYLDR
ncbi:MAG: DNA starvation/stationary phase protection protein [Firmicutes bacterium]|nr:DNA starvation/stationary phase protection protein [Bacillota bacterium]